MCVCVCVCVCACVCACVRVRVCACEHGKSMLKGKAPGEGGRASGDVCYIVGTYM